MNNQAPAYLYSLLSPPNRHYNTRKYSKIRENLRRTETFSNSFLPQTIREWNKLDTSICQAPSYSVFRKALVDFIRPTPNSTFGTNDVSGLKLLIRLRVGFSHLREHEFKHIFQGRLNPLCPCSSEAEDTYHYFMCSQNLSDQRNVLFDGLNSINSEILKMSEKEIVWVLLFRNKSFSKDMNFRIITSSIHFVYPLSANITKWSNILKQLPTNCLSVFDHFVILALKGLKTVKDLMNHPLLERNLFNIFSPE